MKKTRVVTSTKRPEFDELMEYLSRPVSERDGYDYDQEGNIYNIPSVFAKINGMYKDNKKYRENIVDKVAKFPNTYMINDSIIKKYVASLNRDNYNYTVYADKETYLAQDEGLVYYDPTIENFLDGKIYGYKFSLSDCVGFKNLSGSKKEALFNAMLVVVSDPSINHRSLKSLIEGLLNIPDDLTTLVNNWDLKSNAPRIIYTGSAKLKEEEYWLLRLLHKIGFDIIILSPNGANVIEEYCDITTYSLGYYDSDFDFNKYMSSPVDTFKKGFKYIGKQIKSVDWIDWAFLIIPVIVVLINIGVYLVDMSGFAKTMTQAGTCAIVCCAWLFEIGYTPISQDNANFTHGLIVVLLVCLLIIRGAYALFTYQAETNVNSGFIPIEEAVHVGDTEVETTFVTHMKSDMIGLDDDGNIICYIENNSENTDSCYVKIYIGNTEVYKSKNFAPLQYIDYFKVSYDLPEGDTEVTVKYYLFEGNKYVTYTNQLLGESTATIHIGDIESLAKEYGYESIMGGEETSK